MVGLVRELYQQVPCQFLKYKYSNGFSFFMKIAGDNLCTKNINCIKIVHLAELNKGKEKYRVNRRHSVGNLQPLNDRRNQ